MSGRGALDDAAGIHHRDLVGHFGDHAEIVGDQDDRHAGLLLQVAQQIEDLRLHGHVERGGRLVGDQQHRAQASAIAIITRWRMPPDSWCGYSSKPLRRRGCARGPARRSRGPAALRGGAPRSCARIASMIWSPMVKTGLRLVIGSWKIMAMRLPRMARISAGGREAQVAAVEQDAAGGDAAGLGTRRMIDSDSIGLAAAALADDAEGAAGGDGERDAVDRGGVWLRLDGSSDIIMDREHRATDGERARRAAFAGSCRLNGVGRTKQVVASLCASRAVRRRHRRRRNPRRGQP
jgi:hypothetical protein